MSCLLMLCRLLEGMSTVPGRKRFSCVCVECGKEFLATKQVAKYCSRTCNAHNHPLYKQNQELIRVAEFYLSLNFTPAQVFDDFIRDHHNVDSWIKALERRKMWKLAQRFRPLSNRLDGRRAA